MIWCIYGPSLSPTCRLMLAALVILIMIVISNLSALFCCCYATYYYGLWLQTYHRKDLACLRILVRHMLHCRFIQRAADGNTVNDAIPVLMRADMFRSRMVWLSTPHGPPSPRWSTSHWFSTCGVWPGAQRQRLLCASCLERWWLGKLWLVEVKWWEFQWRTSRWIHFLVQLSGQT